MRTIIAIFPLIFALSIEGLPSCNSFYVRWPRVRLNFKAVSESRLSLKTCQNACSIGEDPLNPGKQLECAAINHQNSPDGFSHHCDVFQPHQLQNVDGYVEADDRYTFYWKYCLSSTRKCTGEYAFTYLSDRFMDSRSVVKVTKKSNLEECLSDCLDETSFECRSISFNRTDGGCHMSKDSQITRPESIRLNNNPNFRIDYYENNCYNLSASFQFSSECRDDGILVKVKSRLPYTGALYGLYDFFTCRLEPKETTDFEYLFPSPMISKNCSDSIRFKGDQMILEAVLSTDGIEPLYFITPDDLTYQAKCPMTKIGGAREESSTIRAQPLPHLENRNKEMEASAHALFELLSKGDDESLQNVFDLPLTTSGRQVKPASSSTTTTTTTQKPGSTTSSSTAAVVRLKSPVRTVTSTSQKNVTRTIVAVTSPATIETSTVPVINTADQFSKPKVKETKHKEITQVVKSTALPVNSTTTTTTKPKTTAGKSTAGRVSSVTTTKPTTKIVTSTVSSTTTVLISGAGPVSSTSNFTSTATPATSTTTPTKPKPKSSGAKVAIIVAKNLPNQRAKIFAAVPMTTTRKIDHSTTASSSSTTTTTTAVPTTTTTTTTTNVPTTTSTAPPTTTTSSAPPTTTTSTAPPTTTTSTAPPTTTTSTAPPTTTTVTLEKIVTPIIHAAPPAASSSTTTTARIATTTSEKSQGSGVNMVGKPKIPISFDIFHNGQPVEAVVVGTKITLSFRPHYPIPPEYISVRGCQVEPIDPKYDWEHEPLFIIRDGCPADRVGLVCPPTQSDHGAKVSVEAFRYQTTGQVQYSCLVRICPFAPCPKNDCEDVEGCDSNYMHRYKRELSLDDIRRALEANPELASQIGISPTAFAINRGGNQENRHFTNVVQEQQRIALSGDHVVRRRLVVVNSEDQLRYYVRTGDIL